MIRQTTAAVVACAIATQCFSALAVEDLDEGFSMQINGAAPAYKVNWTARAGRVYFIQYSDSLMSWAYFPLIETGDDTPMEYGFSLTSPRVFARLQVTDLPADNPEIADFDGDGVGNMAEISQGTDPLRATSIDGDDLTDDWEIFHFGNVTTLTSNSGNYDGDEFTDLEESQMGLNPKSDDTATRTSGYTYDSRSQLKGVTGVLIFNYTFDGEGNVTVSN